jgi:hypothetical protein
MTPIALLLLRFLDESHQFFLKYFLTTKLRRPRRKKDLPRRKEKMKENKIELIKKLGHHFSSPVRLFTCSPFSPCRRSAMAERPSCPSFLRG